VIVDDESWCIRELVVDVPTWWTIRHVVVPVAAVERFSWSERCIRLALTRDAVRSSPPMCQAERLGPVYQSLRRAYRDWKAREPASTKDA